MWGGGVEHGSQQEAAPHQLLPWLGAAPFSDPAVGFGAAAMGAYASCDGGVGALAGLGHGGMFGFGFDQQQQQRAVEGSGKAVVSGLLGTLQAELGRMTSREMMEAKALAASRSHSEAERRRRQRINGHLARLRSLLPNTTKTDKASLLAEVLDHVKELKRQTSAMMVAAKASASATAIDDDYEGSEAGPAQLLPSEADELAVDATADRAGRLVVRASLCCEDRPDLIPDMVRALAALRMRARRAEITTLGGRVRSVLLITADDEGAGDLAGEDDVEVGGDGWGRPSGRPRCGRGGHEGTTSSSHRRHECIASVQEALRGVMDRRTTASGDTSSSGAAGGGSIKRQRMNYGAQEPCSV
ncbi:hypothetical protein HU200_037473 [Digitaria exilis]|uniref:BHLH domain-containing protein n=1 Tax=Digitaria exilis TaxID=1010633 RepID=A0A835BCZ3_9POAL|nr:hypothetical protein HU200_037473 [Digitaria exilis]CAB3453356.1 unnamed protein product [Digitaria exilis]